MCLHLMNIQKYTVVDHLKGRHLTITVSSSATMHFIKMDAEETRPCVTRYL